MTRKDIFDAALRQAAIDSGCAPEDFTCGRNIVVPAKKDLRARRYLQLPFLMDLTSYGGSVVASCSSGFEDIAREYISSGNPESLFETPKVSSLNEKLRPLGAGVCFMAEYWLPDPDKIPSPSCQYELRLLEGGELLGLYMPQWGNALCKTRSYLDRLAMGAYDSGKLVALAGCSADCDTMWQIGVDVLPEYRGQGLAHTLTSHLAHEIMARGIVPFYCCAWSNIPSARNAIKSGFVPAWAQLTVKPLEYIAKMK